MKTKHPHEMAVKKSISLPAVLFAQGVDRMRSVGLYSFSDYVQELIRRDLHTKAPPLYLRERN